MAEIPAPIPTDPEDVSWALETANARWKRGDQSDALNWLQRAIQILRDAGHIPRARELEVVFSFLQPPPKEEEIEVEIDPVPGLEEIADLEEVEEVAAPKAPQQPPPRKPPGPPPRPASPSIPSPRISPSPVNPPVAPPPTLASPPIKPAVEARTSTPDFLENGDTVTDWPPTGLQFPSHRESIPEPAPSPTAPEIFSLEQTVTEWPPKGISKEFLASFSSSEATESSPKTSQAASTKPPVQSVEKDPPKTLVAPAPLDLDEDWFEAEGPSTFRPPSAQSDSPPLATLLQQQRKSLLPPPEVVLRDSAPNLTIAVPSEVKAPPQSEPQKTSTTVSAIKIPPRPAVHPEVAGAPPTKKWSIPNELIEAAGPQSTVLDELPAFIDIPAEHRSTFFREAKRKNLRAREVVRGFALGVVLQGEAHVLGGKSDLVVAKLTAGSSLRARGTVGKTVPLRIAAGTGGCEVVTWSEAPLQTTLQNCPWVDTELRSSANTILGRVGAANGLLGALEPQIFEQLCDWLQPRVLAVNEIVLHEGETTPPLLVVGTGNIELVKNGKVERTLSTGSLVLPAECARGVKADVQARAGADGAVVMQIDKARRQAMQTSLPTVIALLSGL